MIRYFRSARTAASAARTGFYGVVATTLAITDAQAVALLDAIIIGIVLADFGTWLIRTMMTLPTEIFHGCYDGLVNLVFAWFFVRIEPLAPDFDNEAMAAGFMVFLLVLGLKIAYYAIDFARDSISEDV
ncbi:MAG TPA: hypothetical protein VIH35_04270 [Kiritimatiellia bacterium]|jgi:hypothetical protein